MIEPINEKKFRERQVTFIDWFYLNYFFDLPTKTRESLVEKHQKLMDELDAGFLLYLASLNEIADNLKPPKKGKVRQDTRD